jgi:hypothetical protein
MKRTTILLLAGLMAATPSFTLSTVASAAISEDASATAKAAYNAAKAAIKAYMDATSIRPPARSRSPEQLEKARAALDAAIGNILAGATTLALAQEIKAGLQAAGTEPGGFFLEGALSSLDVTIANFQAKQSQFAKKDVPAGTPPSGVNNTNTNCTPSVSPFRSC